MATFETLVRPVVFPNIRPQRAQSLAPEDDPTKGIAVIKGASGRVIDLPSSWSQQTTRERHVEIQRRVDEVRVSQMDDNGNVNEENFVDLFITNKAWFKKGGKTITGGADDIVYYKRAAETDNIKIRDTDKIIKNPQA